MAFKLIFLSALVYCAYAQDDTNAPFEANGPGNRGREENGNCLAGCMRQGIESSQDVVEAEFDNTCRNYREVSSCLRRCGGNRWDRIAREMERYCDDQERRYKRSDCPDRWVGKGYDRCLQKCSRNSKNWLMGQDLNTYCRTLHCFIPCIIDELNQHCPRSGYRLGNLFYTPYVVIYESPSLYPFYITALRQIPNSCGLFYVGNFMRANNEDEEKEAIEFDLTLPNFNDTAPVINTP